uniref:Uncharacterized protein n=1 Tax=Anguilla anguilla TaxID=7936 RepID=A0A0E9SSQ6_ANGAN
MKRPSSCTKN